MNRKPKLSEHIRHRTKEWFRKAEHDLKFLENAPFDIEDPPTDTACRLAHMVAEYSLKGYLMLNKKKIKKLHELDDLLDACISIHQDKTFEELREDCIDLTRYKVEMTYPGHVPVEIDVEEARAAIEKARRIKDFIMNKAEELGY
ncbi:MAG: HEPN domain-containing protein [candidate division KSB1 bacterium]|nr:HEPN domain-containing protein [candidate division KSB1 bacterium]MDZ7300946.1 HEPN domain-containing protein [candidate division KSB1 bacterium]MDZ7310376.1 HEPN domain-containing protein [candidate division KSB1 bacterium]